MGKFEFFISKEQAGARIDSFLAQQDIGLSRSAVQQLLEKGLVCCDGKSVAKNTKIQAGTIVEIQVPDAQPLNAEPQDIPIEIVYEDDNLLVVNKPKGMVVHPAPGNLDGTLVNALLYHCAGRLSSIGGVVRPGIVHRIDKDTSGLLVVAKDDSTHIALSQQMAEHSIERIYNTIVYGNFKSPEGYVEAPIGRHPTDRKKMAVTAQNSKYAYTAYRELERFQGFTKLECQLKTGRTHQIRVHMASIGHPVAGDPVYGPKNVIKKLDGQCLHAKTLGFVHPATGNRMFFDSELPRYFIEFAASLRKEQV